LRTEGVFRIRLCWRSMLEKVETTVAIGRSEGWR